jgi:hypothetical protein
MSAKKAEDKNQCSPLLASIHWDPAKDTEEERLEWLREFVKLPLEIRLGLGSLEIENLVRKVAEKHQIKDYREVGELARIVRDVFWKEIGRPKILKRLEKIRNVGINQKVLFNDLIKVIHEVWKIGLQQAQVETEELPILKAIKKYPEVGEMLISEKPIKLEIFNHLMRPSVKNWLESYFEKMGTARHNSLERGHFLFDSENAKQLSWRERKRLDEVLRSFDNAEDLLIDIKNQRIVFRGEDWLIPKGLVEIEHTKEASQEKINGQKGFLAESTKEEIDKNVEKKQRGKDYVSDLSRPKTKNSLIAGTVDLRKRTISPVNTLNSQKKKKNILDLRKD